MPVYTSKVDAWLIAIILGAGAVVVARAMLRAPRPGGWVIAAFLLLLCVGLPLWLFLSTRYTLTDTDLLVRCGPFRWRIPLHEITAVTPTHNPLSSPAPSLDRLRIDYGRGRSVMISPSDKEAFISDLEARQSALKQ